MVKSQDKILEFLEIILQFQPILIPRMGKSYSIPRISNLISNPDFRTQNFPYISHILARISPAFPRLSNKSETSSNTFPLIYNKLRTVYWTKFQLRLIAIVNQNLQNCIHVYWLDTKLHPQFQHQLTSTRKIQLSWILTTYSWNWQ